MTYKNCAFIKILSRTENIGFARVSVASFASQLEFTLGELEEIKVAVSEGISNAIMHAYGGDQDGEITIKLLIEGNLLTIEIRDKGPGIEKIKGIFEPTFTKAGRMGLGLVFMDSFMDSVRITSPPDGGTSLTMEKRPQREKEKIYGGERDGGTGESS